MSKQAISKAGLTAEHSSSGLATLGLAIVLTFAALAAALVLPALS